MRNFFLFSKTMWNEAPRLRHQLAELLRTNHNQVIFFQKPAYAWKSSKHTPQAANQLTILTSKQLIHPQLRVTRILSWLNSLIETDSIRSTLSHLDPPDAIINFNYDYYFLRRLFPKTKIITIINDDFIAQARLFSGVHVRRSLKLTCEASDAVLCVSYPLQRQLSEWCEPKLFLPWADIDYAPPTENPTRQSVLLWGHIDRRIDFDVILRAAHARPTIKFSLVGPVAVECKQIVADVIHAHSNVELLSPRSLAELPIDQYFAGIIPYKKGIRDIEAVTASNKTFQLMARGLPLVTHGMPSFLRDRAIFNTSGADAFIRALDVCSADFHQLQDSIANLIKSNRPTERYSFLQSLLTDQGL